MNDLGRMLIGIGALLVVIGVAVVLLGKFNIPIGRFPGDFRWQSRSGNTRVYFPFATSIILSLVLTLVLWLINAFRR